jgi:2-methylcitrate dehydratase PrpD
MHETRALAQFVVNLQFADLPPRLTEDLKIIVLDAFAAGIIGTAQPWARMVVELVHELGGKPEASIINQSWRTDISRAALVLLC